MTARTAVDLSLSYTLLSGTRVIARSDDSVQIGAEAPRWLILRAAPAEAVDVLTSLRSGTSAGEVLDRRGADPLVWTDLLNQMHRLGLLVPAAEHQFAGMTPDTGFDAERDSLVHRFGVGPARRLWAARAEALVVVRGSGPLAAGIADLFAASGIGHVHHAPERTTPRGADDGAALTAQFAARLRSVCSTVRTYPPATHQHPMLVVLAGIAPEAPWDALQLLRDRVAHLAVRTQLTSVSVGPLVLPGRSTCLLCVLRHRNAIDEGWAAFEAGLRIEPIAPTRALAAAAATLAVMDGLTHIDGLAMPATIDGTVEWNAGELAPRRRSWDVHPDCECRRIKIDGGESLAPDAD